MIHISVELSHVCPIDEIPAHAATIEAHGFYRVWIPDTVVSPWEAWLVAALLVQQTQHVRLGLGVTNPYTRHPVVMAQMAATLQRCSHGRFALSLGKGIAPFLVKIGVQQQETAVAECITILRRLLAGERTSFKGRVFQLDTVLLRTPPAQPPVPIFLAAISPASWQQALRIADGIVTVWSAALHASPRHRQGPARLPTAVLLPFAQSRTDFFAQPLRTFAELQERVQALAAAGFDEVIIAYAELADLAEAARLLV